MRWYSVLLLAVLALAGLLVPPSHAWPGMARYECDCPNHIQCWRFTCRSRKFTCNCDECSCFPPRNRLEEESEETTDFSRNDIQLMEMLFRSGFGGFSGKKK